MLKFILIEGDIVGTTLMVAAGTFHLEAIVVGIILGVAFIPSAAEVGIDLKVVHTVGVVACQASLGVVLAFSQAVVDIRTMEPKAATGHIPSEVVRQNQVGVNILAIHIMEPIASWVVTLVEATFAFEKS